MQNAHSDSDPRRYSPTADMIAEAMATLERFREAGADIDLRTGRMVPQPSRWMVFGHGLVRLGNHGFSSDLTDGCV